MSKALPCIGLLSLCSFAAVAAAQSPLPLPPAYERIFGRPSTALLGNDSTRTQLVYAQPFAPGTVITGIRFRPSTLDLDNAAFSAVMEIRCSSSTATPGALSTTFTTNIGTDELLVLPQQSVNIPAMPANRGTGAVAEILFTTPFVFGLNGAPNLVVDVKVLSRSAGAEWDTDRVFASANGRTAQHGRGCSTATINATSTGGTFVAGSTVTMSIGSAPPNSIVALVPSFDMKEFVPGFLLPFDLSLVGAAPGCDVLVGNEVGPVPVLTDGAGAASVPLPIPSTFSQAGLAFQWLVLVPPTPSNPLGIETTPAQLVFIGPEVATPSYQYVYSLFNAGAATGTANVNAMPIVELLVQ